MYITYPFADIFKKKKIAPGLKEKIPSLESPWLRAWLKMFNFIQGITSPRLKERCCSSDKQGIFSNDSFKWNIPACITVYTFHWVELLSVFSWSCWRRSLKSFKVPSCRSSNGKLIPRIQKVSNCRARADPSVNFLRSACIICASMQPFARTWRVTALTKCVPELVGVIHQIPTSVAVVQKLAQIQRWSQGWIYWGFERCAYRRGCRRGVQI